MRQAPSPSALHLFKNISRMRNNLIDFYSDLLVKYGDVVRFRFGPLNIFILNHPEHFKHVLRDHWESYPKSSRYSVFKPMIGNGLLTSEGEVWKKKRKAAQPAFHKESLESFAAFMTQYMQDTLDSWQVNAQKDLPVDIHRDMGALTLRVAGMALFGADVQNEAMKVTESLDIFMKEAEKRALSLMPWIYRLPSRSKFRFDRSIQLMDEVIYKIIDEKRKKGSTKVDLLDRLIAADAASTGDGSVMNGTSAAAEKFTDSELRHEIATLLIGGHETSANALTWILALVAEHPHIQSQLRDEARQIFNLNPSGLTPLASLKALPYTRAVIEEGLRLYPPVWLFTREALKDDEISGYHIPKGSVVALSPYFLHRRTENWEEPLKFNPDRFARGLSDTNKLAFAPFGLGPRSCIGSHFAMMEMQLMLPMLVHRYEFHPMPNHRVRPEPTLTLRPWGGLKLRVKPVMQAPISHS